MLECRLNSLFRSYATLSREISKIYGFPNNNFSLSQHLFIYFGKSIIYHKMQIKLIFTMVSDTLQVLYSFG
jgi:hypothetical protein